MFKHKSTKLTICLVIAVLMVASLMLTACDGAAFEPVTMPPEAAPEGNGGNAVKYGDYIYYVNGYQSSSSAENTYTKINARTGAIARIRVEDLESLFEVYNDSKFTTSTARTDEIARIVADKAEIVVPKFYYSGNTTSTQINGIYIFNGRLYMLTPNDGTTAGGSPLTSQTVLTSFKLDGSNEQRHYVFTNNAAQVMLNVVNDKLVATYIMDAVVGCVDVEKGTEIAKIEKTTSARIDVAGKAVFYLNEDGAICKLNAGDADAKTLVANDKDSHITYTISNVNDGYVYYTEANSTNSAINGMRVYYANEATAQNNTEAENRIALKAEAPSANWFGYGEYIVKTISDEVHGVSLYGISLLTSNNGDTSKTIVAPIQNSDSITFNRIEGSMLYYTSNSVAYMVDLSKDDGPVAIGKSLSSSSGWSVPDILGEYVITLSSGSVSAVKFNAKDKENSSSVTLTIVEPKTDED